MQLCNKTNYKISTCLLVNYHPGVCVSRKAKKNLPRVAIFKVIGKKSPKMKLGEANDLKWNLRLKNVSLVHLML